MCYSGKVRQGRNGASGFWDRDYKDGGRCPHTPTSEECRRSRRDAPRWIRLLYLGILSLAQARPDEASIIEF